MSEIVNLRRVRKEKTRVKKKAQCEAARAKTMVPKRLRELEKSRRAKILHDIDASRLEDE